MSALRHPPECSAPPVPAPARRVPAIAARAGTLYPLRRARLIALIALLLAAPVASACPWCRGDVLALVFADDFFSTAAAVIAPVAIAVALVFVPWRRRHD